MLRMSSYIKHMFVFMIFFMLQYPSISYRVGEINRRSRSIAKNDSSVLDTGIGAIGLYLGHSIKHLPIQEDDYFYRIHHHYHNRDKVMKEIKILPRDITICRGNPGSFCPNGSRALCTKNEAIRCITSLWDTELCEESIFNHCAKVSLPCAFYTPECNLGRRFIDGEMFDINLPYISMLQMHSNLIYVNGTVIAQDLKKIYPPDMFCVTILALPDKITKGEDLLERSSKMFGNIAVRALGID